MVDAFCGAPGFAVSARRELEELFGELKPLAAGAELALGLVPGGPTCPGEFSSRAPPLNVQSTRAGRATRNSYWWDG